MVCGAVPQDKQLPVPSSIPTLVILGIVRDRQLKSDTVSPNDRIDLISFS